MKLWTASVQKINIYIDMNSTRANSIWLIIEKQTNIIFGIYSRCQIKVRQIRVPGILTPSLRRWGRGRDAGFCIGIKLYPSENVEAVAVFVFILLKRSTLEAH